MSAERHTRKEYLGARTVAELSTTLTVLPLAPEHGILHTAIDAALLIKLELLWLLLLLLLLLLLSVGRCRACDLGFGLLLVGRV